MVHIQFVFDCGITMDPYCVASEREYLTKQQYHVER